MVNAVTTLTEIMKRSEYVKKEYQILLDESAYKAVYDLVDAYQELGHSFEDATRAVFDGVTAVILGTCRGRCEQNDEIWLMKATIAKRTRDFDEN